MEPEFYDRYFAIEGWHWWFVGRRAVVLDVMSRHITASGSLRVLDFGCGTGGFLTYLDGLGEVTAVDEDPAAVAFCRARGRSGVEVVDGTGRLPFDDEAFDVITALDVIEHIDHDVAALHELRRVLRPGGTLVVTVPAYGFLWGDQDEISHHGRRYTVTTLRRAVAAAGLRTVYDSYFNTLLFVPIALVRVGRRMFRKPSNRRTDFSVGPPWLSDPLAAVFAFERYALRRTRLPFGVSIIAIVTV